MYRKRELQAESDETANLTKLRSLFPDYCSGFKNLMADTDADKDGGIGDLRSEVGAADLDARVEAFGYTSDKQVVSVVIRHGRTFVSPSARRRQAVRGLITPCRCLHPGGVLRPTVVPASFASSMCRSEGLLKVDFPLIPHMESALAGATGLCKSGRSLREYVTGVAAATGCGDGLLTAVAKNEGPKKERPGTSARGVSGVG